MHKTKKSLGLKNKNVFARAKKALGQNFLKSGVALKKIVEAGEIKPGLPAQAGDVILEIGPGKGALTEKLLASNCQLIAVEKDRNLCDLLKIKFNKEISSCQLTLIHKDILNFDLNHKLLAKSYKLIANIPYNITGAILKKFLTAKNQPSKMVLMVQHEVVKRIIARDKKESILSISVKAYGEPKLIMKVPARYFSPAPKVDSAIIAINDISRKNFLPPPNLPLTKGEVPKAEGVGEEKFWKIVKAGFAHKRKMLAGNLKLLFGNQVTQVFKAAKIKENVRAEDLSLEDWLTITALEKNPSLG